MQIRLSLRYWRLDRLTGLFIRLTNRRRKYDCGAANSNGLPICYKEQIFPQNNRTRLARYDGVAVRSSRV